MIPSLWAGLCEWLLPGPPFCQVLLTLGHNVIGHFLGACMTGWACGWSCILYSPGNLLIQWIYQGILSSSHQWDLLLLLPEWVLCLSDFYLVEWSQQHSSLGPLLTSCLLGDQREQDQVCLWCTSMSESCVVGLQECLVARGWGHRGFHTGESETHCRQLAWFVWGPGQWACHLGWFVLECSCWNRQRASMLPPDLVSILTWTEAVPLFASAWRQFDDCVCFIALLGTDVVNDHLLWVHVSYCSTVHCSNKQVFVWGLFSVLALAACGSLPFSRFLKQVWWQDACGLVVLQLWHFAHPVTLFPTTFACWVMGRAVVSTGRVLTGAVGAQCVGCQWLGIMCLVGVAYSLGTTCPTHIAAIPDSTA